MSGKTEKNPPKTFAENVPVIGEVVKKGNMYFKYHGIVEISFGVLILSIMTLSYLLYRAALYDMLNVYYLNALQDQIEINNYDTDRRRIIKIMEEERLLKQLKVNKINQVLISASEGFFIGAMAGFMTGNKYSMAKSAIIWFLVQGIFTGMKTNMNHEYLIRTGREEKTINDVFETFKNKINRKKVLA